MRNKMNLTFETARNIVKGLMAVALILCVAALLIDRQGENGFATIAAVTALVCIALALFLVFTGLQCPYCGRHIIRKCLVVKACPYCGRDLASGVRQKKSKRR